MINNKNKTTTDLNSKENDELNFLWLISTLYRQKNIILSTTFLFVLISIPIIQFKKPVWKGQFQIVIEDKNSKTKFNLSSNLTNDPILAILGDVNSTSINTEVEILKSPSVLQPVYSFVKDYKSKQGVNIKNMSYINWLKGSVKVEIAKGTSVLNISYIDSDKELILSTLKLISKKYQMYSGRDREKGLNQGINYLKSQVDLMRNKSSDSMSKLQVFSLKNGLGDQDGLPSIEDKMNENKGSEELGLNQLNIQSSSNATQSINQRYANQFKKLQALEALKVEKEAILKPDSQIIKNLEKKIKSLRNSINRPQEVLLKYRQLKRNAIREESLVDTLENQLGLIYIERAKQNNPWELISKPTLFLKPVSPNKPRILFTGLIGGILTGVSLSFIKERRSGLIYNIDEVKQIIPFKNIKNINRSSIPKWESIFKVLKLGPLMIKESEKIGFINSSNLGREIDDGIKNALNLSLGNDNFLYSSNILDLKNCKNQILLIDFKNVNRNEIKSIIEDLYMQEESKVSGWIGII